MVLWLVGVQHCAVTCCVGDVLPCYSGVVWWRCAAALLRCRHVVMHRRRFVGAPSWICGIRGGRGGRGDTVTWLIVVFTWVACGNRLLAGFRLEGCCGIAVQAWTLSLLTTACRLCELSLLAMCWCIFRRALCLCVLRWWDGDVRGC